jgi:cell division protein FtsB
MEMTIKDKKDFYDFQIDKLKKKIENLEVEKTEIKIEIKQLKEKKKNIK